MFSATTFSSRQEIVEMFRIRHLCEWVALQAVEIKKSILIGHSSLAPFDVDDVDALLIVTIASCGSGSSCCCCCCC